MEMSIYLVFSMVSIFPWQFTACTNPADNFEEWFHHLNTELSSIYRESAHFAWSLSVQGDDNMAAESRKFNAEKLKWSEMKCSEIQDLLALASQYPFTSTISNFTVLNSCARLLCAGPKFNEEQSKQLTLYLQQMQSIFTTTQICLPKHFDICLNLDHIWDFTYVLRGADGHFQHLDLAAVKPKINHATKLRYYDGSIPQNYYLNGVMEVTSHQSKKIEADFCPKDAVCFGGEEELELIMRGDFTAFNRSDCAMRFNEVFRWAWESWRAAVGNDIGSIYAKAIDIMNLGAKANGYHDIGDVWRQEVELPNLQATIDSLLQEIRPFHRLLHGVLRTVLWNKINKFEPFDRKSTIPAHMLGSMWSQNWQLYRNLILPFDDFHLDKTIKSLNWTSIDMVKKADDFYRSLNLPAMTHKFWQNSIFEKNEKFRNCHGTAANMFEPNDYRMIVCAKQTLDDFGVIVHEMGHIQYFMACKNQPTVFQDANAAVQESIGDAIFLAMMTPQHLNRINLLPDKYLLVNRPSVFTGPILRAIFSHPEPLKTDADRSNAGTDELDNDYLTVNGYAYPRLSKLNRLQSESDQFKSKQMREINDYDLVLLLHMALAKIPAIPFQYMMDAFRWNLFNETITMRDANAYFWNLAVNEQGIHPPDKIDRRDYFDLGGKFHISDNTPYTRYFLASFLQAQIFEGLCKVTVYDTVHTNRPLPMPLHRCDIYGSKRAGKLLKSALQLGTSKHWTNILYMLTGKRTVTADALLLYYKPIINWLDPLVQDFDIPLGW